MAESRPRLRRRETLQDQTRDLELLFPNGYGSISDMDQGTKLRDKRIEDLKKANGTFEKVVLSSMKHFSLPN